MPRNLWEIFKMLEDDDFRVLRAIERFHGKYEYVPVELVEKAAGLPPSRLVKALHRLSNLKLVKRRLGNLSGYTLTYMGLDLLALRNLVARGIIEELGDKIGVGKEGDVYIGVSPGGDRVVVKFHRAGRESFRKIRRHRSYALDVRATTWLILAKIVGEREFKALVALEREGAKVPPAIAWNRHAVVQKYVDGLELSIVRELDEESAFRVLVDSVETLRIAYTRVGIVHGDLSEYNILVKLGEPVEAYIIDWPQYVYKDEPNAEELLRRDVTYLLRFLKRRFGLSLDVEEVLRYVKGEVDEPPW
ncbi:MAG: serine/threonine protein kinase [Desulfurococcales archaeon]|nr:serine/threonine protein kinase [Desulfurococcales archaeon]